MRQQQPTVVPKDDVMPESGDAPRIISELQRRGSSQVALLTDKQYATGIARIDSAIRRAEGDAPVFKVDIAFTIQCGSIDLSPSASEQSHSLQSSRCENTARMLLRNRPTPCVTVADDGCWRIRPGKVYFLRPLIAYIGNKRTHSAFQAALLQDSHTV
jgi:hypothetical protein